MLQPLRRELEAQAAPAAQEQVGRVQLREGVGGCPLAATTTAEQAARLNVPATLLVLQWEGHHQQRQLFTMDAPVPAIQATEASAEQAEAVVTAHHHSVAAAVGATPEV